MDPSSATTTAIGLIHQFADTLDTLGPGQFRSPTPCAGWTVEDLAAHVATGLFTAAEAFHRARFGALSPPSKISGPIPSDALADRIRLGASHLREALDRGPRTWPDIGLRFGRYPFAAALQCLVIEYGVHCNDLTRATTDPAAPFPRAAVDALFGFGAQYLLLQAEPLEAPEIPEAPGTPPMKYTLRAPSATMTIAWDGARWREGTGSDGPGCTISGSDDDIARLMLRRMDADELDLDDPHALASGFVTAIRPL
ncbi:maleylpyruvate isomerase family mycothiol-dependent enzyme [Mycobacterium sp. ACS4331]|uniref:maleylpyruvate isomerase family mycothiol-dependent enzyme n=1 Tax=Mycobacterium sp. ACS4331 TaxID=1834121 RepID=UPI0007FE98C2|nr:maleylpyruvate isomerase family mycothiol-dependent enzyme [Mycobacterium sp. ACS4331]OBF27425.1 hypothetical protein A5727_26175 [Mycobacterium sp. ACS4331]